jgi:hypothetical protein
MKHLAILILSSLPLWSQAAGANLIERLNRMSPAERQRALNRMPADRRAILERRMNALNNINPEAKQKLQRDYQHFQKLPRDKQDEARKTLRQIADLPEGRRKLVRGAIHNLRQQSPEIQQQRLESRAFQRRFEEEERKLIREALSVLPPPEHATEPNSK